MNKRITAQDVIHAYQNIKGEIIKTPLVYSSELSRLSGAKVFLKMEHMQLTGSFKIRGVLNKLKQLSPREIDEGLLAASTGNHAAAFAYASRFYNCRKVLFMPENVSEVKRNALASYNLKLFLKGKNSIECERVAGNYARMHAFTFIHPYNDPEIIKGQGTIGVELQDELSDLDAVLAPIGGGGLVSGLCSFFQDSKTKVIGVQSDQASEMYDSLREGHIVPPSVHETIADASAGGIEDGALTFDICKEHLEKVELVSEDAIEKAIAFMCEHHQTIIEPGAALSVAAMMNTKAYHGQTVALVLTGKKINKPLLQKIRQQYGTCN